MRWAHFYGTHLEVAHLNAADLRGAHLESVYLVAADLKKAYLERAYLVGANLEWADLEGADLFGAQVTESDFNQLPTSISQAQKADLIVLALIYSLTSTRTYQLIATRKTEASAHQIEIGEKFKHTIYSYQLDEQRTKALNQANWEIEIKELSPNNQQP